MLGLGRRNHNARVTLASDDAGLDFSARDVRQLVKSRRYLDLEALPNANDVVRLDARPDLVLRWEVSDPADAVLDIPTTEAGLIDHVGWYEQELRYLARLGISALKHQTYVASGSELGDMAQLFTVAEYVDGLESMFHTPDLEDDSLPFPDTPAHRQRAIAFGTALGTYLDGCIFHKRSPVFDIEEARQYADLGMPTAVATLFDFDHGQMPLEDITEAQARLEHLIRISLRK